MSDQSLRACRRPTGGAPPHAEAPAFRRVSHVALMLSLAALAFAGLFVLTAAACGGSSDDATSYEGIWVNRQPNNEVWLTIEAHADGYRLTWERPWDPPQTQNATVEDDGALSVVAVEPSPGAETIPLGFETLRLTDDGRLEASATTSVSGVESPVGVTMVLEPGEEDAYAAFRAKVDENLAEQSLEDAFSADLDTLAGAVQTWAHEHGDVAPPADEVRPGGEIEAVLAAHGETWPTIGDGSPLMPGKGRGEYSYVPRKNGFTLGGKSQSGQRQALTVTW